MSAPVYAELETGGGQWKFLLSLTPLLIWGVASYGFWPLLMVACTVLLALLADGFGQKISGRKAGISLEVLSWSLLVALSCPPHIPFFIPGIVMIPVVFLTRYLYGAKGGHWLHPVALAWVILSVSWAHFFGDHPYPAGLDTDVITGATPLQILTRFVGQPGGGGIQMLAGQGYPISGSDQNLTAFFNNILAPLNISLPKGYFDLFWGNTPGALGEGSSLILLILSVFLLGSRTIRWEVPAMGFLSFSLLVYFFGGVMHQGGLASGDVLFHLFSGGFLFCLFLMAGDPLTTPLTRSGLLVFGFGFGGLSFVFRLLGPAPGGSAFALLIMNLLSPSIDWFFTSYFRKKSGRLQKPVLKYDGMGS